MDAIRRFRTYLNRRTFTTSLVYLALQHPIRWSSDERTYPGVAHVIQSTSLPLTLSISASNLPSLPPPFFFLYYSKFPNNPEATYAFQKVSVAYNVLSDPVSKRAYDLHPAANEFSGNTSGATMGAEETLRTVVIGILNDFLDGDLEMVRTLLRKSPSTSGRLAEKMTSSTCPGGINDLSPSLRLGDEGIDSILLTLQGLRDRVLSMHILTQPYWPCVDVFAH